ncbi:MAG: hypothetical protein DRO12_03505 [Thermoprotei archaeon]|nr:MAG: hypothetical protein DRO12_03505 [Thermoprotei archaeon]
MIEIKLKLDAEEFAKDVASLVQNMINSFKGQRELRLAVAMKLRDRIIQELADRLYEKGKFKIEKGKAIFIIEGTDTKIEVDIKQIVESMIRARISEIVEDVLERAFEPSDEEDP